MEICSLCEDYLYWLREDSGTAVALQDYVVTDKNLLSFTKGQKIELLSRSQIPFSSLPLPEWLNSHSRAGKVTGGGAS